jgi:transposase
MPLPITLAEAHALILRQRDELAAAEARASGAEAMIAHLKLMIAKLRCEQYGQSSERGRKVLDQLELQWIPDHWGPRRPQQASLRR